MRLPILVIALLVLFGGCATRLPSPPGATPGTSAGAPAPNASLAAEQRRLAGLFQGTPVVFSMQPDSSLRVTVPLHYAFDKGRFAVKPPLGAVLDRIAKSQRTEATRLLVAAPTDPGSKRLLLATERAASARDYMVARGIDATRFSISALSSGASVVIVVADPSLH